MRTNKSKDEEVRSPRKKGNTPSKSRSSRKDMANSSSKSQVVSDFAGTKTNDPKWYTNNPALSRDVGSIWFSRPTGLPLQNAVINDNLSVTDPGIMVVGTMLGWGGNGLDWFSSIHPGTPGDPINLTATKLYQYVVHANSRNVSYDKKDLLMTMMAIDGVWQLLGEAIRSYRLIAQYDITNKYMANLVRACGWDPEDLKSNVAQFRYYINYAISRINKFFIPDLFDMWKVHGSAYTNVYLDEPTSKAQYIVKVPKGYWMYNDIAGDLNYVCKFTPPGGSEINLTHGASVAKITVKVFSTLIDYMISSIENSQYLGIIQGDLLKAFGFERMAQFNYVDIDMPIYPVYDQEFLVKLHNADITGFITSKCVTYTNPDTSVIATSATYRDTDDVDGNIAYYDAQSYHRMKDAIGHTYVDIPDGIDPSSETVLLMSLYKCPKFNTTTSRLRPVAGTDPITLYIGSPMPEMVKTVTVYVDPDDMTRHMSVSNVAELTTVEDAVGFADRAATLQKFVSYPPYFASYSGKVIMLWQTDNFTEMTDDQVFNINNVILWSLWSNSTISAN